MSNKKPFIPDTLPIKQINWERFIPLIGKANRAIAEFGGVLKVMVNPELLLHPLTTNEAVLSSRIEGTQATLKDVLAFEASHKTDRDETDDIREILNYRAALLYAVKYLEKKPLCLNLIKEVHSLLLDSVRGQNKARGEFRKEQNYIGIPNSPIEQAIYIPPPPDNLLDYLSNWEKYIHLEEKDYIIQLAIIHAQFEIIHPFLDGNGRIGRILLPLFLYTRELISKPVFYMSEYLETHRDEYYQYLNLISSTGNWNDWIDFFLNAVIKQAESNTQKANDIIGLYESTKRTIYDLNSKFGLPALDTIFQYAIFNSTFFLSYSGIPTRTSANRLLIDMVDKGILQILKKGEGRKPNIYIFTNLFEIIK